MSEHRIPLTPIERELKTSKAQVEANKKYDAKFDKVYFRIPTELKRAVKDRADSMGKSIAQYFIDLAKSDIVDAALSDSDS